MNCHNLLTIFVILVCFYYIVLYIVVYALTSQPWTDIQTNTLQANIFSFFLFVLFFPTSRRLHVLPVVVIVDITI